MRKTILCAVLLALASPAVCAVESTPPSPLGGYNPFGVPMLSVSVAVSREEPRLVCRWVAVNPATVSSLAPMGRAVDVQVRWGGELMSLADLYKQIDEAPFFGDVYLQSGYYCPQSLFDSDGSVQWSAYLVGLPVRVSGGLDVPGAFGASLLLKNQSWPQLSGAFSRKLRTRSPLSAPPRQ